ncbi:hypothetical protein HK104_006117, partial [Borealophlyctis nickersoniae]
MPWSLKRFIRLVTATREQPTNAFTATFTTTVLVTTDAKQVATPAIAITGINPTSDEQVTEETVQTTVTKHSPLAAAEFVKMTAGTDGLCLNLVVHLLRAGSTLDIQVWDKDQFVPDDHMGSAGYVVSGYERVENEIALDVSEGKGWKFWKGMGKRTPKVYIRLQPMPCPPGNPTKVIGPIRYRKEPSSAIGRVAGIGERPFITYRVNLLD